VCLWHQWLVSSCSLCAHGFARKLDRATDVFLQQEGIYAIHGYTFDKEDEEHGVVGRFGKEAEATAETIPHYALYNAGINLLQLLPEVVVVTQEDKDDLPTFINGLRKVPNLFQVPSSVNSGPRHVRRVWVDQTATTLPWSAAAKAYYGF
jgi:hypothetical protein